MELSVSFKDIKIESLELVNHRYRTWFRLHGCTGLPDSILVAKTKLTFNLLCVNFKFGKNKRKIFFYSETML